MVHSSYNFYRFVAETQMVHSSFKFHKLSLKHRWYTAHTILINCRWNTDDTQLIQFNKFVAETQMIHRWYTVYTNFINCCQHKEKTKNYFKKFSTVFGLERKSQLSIASLVKDRICHFYFNLFFKTYFTS